MSIICDDGILTSEDMRNIIKSAIRSVRERNKQRHLNEVVNEKETPDERLSRVLESLKEDGIIINDQRNLKI